MMTRILILQLLLLSAMLGHAANPHSDYPADGSTPAPIVTPIDEDDLTVPNAEMLHTTAIQVMNETSACMVSGNEILLTEAEGITTPMYPVQIARPFKAGEIADFPEVLIDGVPTLTQAQVNTRWGDGSVKHAILNFNIPQLDANSTVILSFQNQIDDHQSGFLTQAQMLDAVYDFDAQMELIDNNTLTASARTMLSNGDFSYWLKGEVATSILLGDHSINRTYDVGFDSENSFRPLFYVTFWPATHQVDIRFVGEISNTEHLQNMTYELNLYTGWNNPQLQYNKPSFTHHAMSRWTKRFWLGGQPPKVNMDHGLPYLEETTLIPNYNPDRVVSATVINNQYNSWLGAAKDINDGGNWQKYMPSTGGRKDIGPYPSWVVQWLYTGDWRMLEQSAGNADLAGAWPMYLREGDPNKYFDRDSTVLGLGKVISISDRPTFWFTRLDWHKTEPEDAVVPVGPITNGGWTPDNAHQPDPYSLLYMLTGEYWYLEQLYFWGSFGAANHDGSCTNCVYGRGPTGREGGLPGQVRGQAWLFRTRVRTAMLAPTGTAEKDYFTTLINDAISIWEGEHNITNTPNYQNETWTWGYDILGGDDVSPLNHWRKGNVYSAETSCLDLNLACEAGSPWQDNFLIFALGRGQQLGFDSDRLRTWLGEHLVNILTHPDFDPYRIANYREPTTMAGSCDWFDSWADMLDTYQPDCEDAVIEFNNQLNDAEHGYPHIARAATSFVADLPNGPGAWGFIEPATDDPVLEDNPKWDLLPTEDMILPVELTDISVRLVEDCVAALSWLAETEERFSHYEIQRSTDGRQYQTIGRVDATGGANINQAYQHYDQDASAKNYYRLVMVDLDGTVNFSKVIYLEAGCKERSGLLVYPNPLTIQDGVLNVKLYHTQANTTVLTIVNVLGQVVKQTSMPVARGWNTFTVKVSDLPVGTYFIRDSDDQRASRFVLTSR